VYACGVDVNAVTANAVILKGSEIIGYSIFTHRA